MLIYLSISIRFQFHEKLTHNFTEWLKFWNDQVIAKNFHDKRGICSHNFLQILKALKTE